MTQTARDANEPLNAQIINDGAGRQDAVDLGHGIFMSRDVSNLYLVTTADGNVLVNTGIIYSAAENRRRFDAVSDQPIRKIVLTQSHEDHIGGWPTFSGPEVETIGQANLPFVRKQYRDLGTTMGARSRRLWSRDQKRELTERPEPVLTTTFQDSHRFEQGGRAFELLSVKGGETVDSLAVWLPQERIVFTGNMTGPIFGHVPNLYTVRGERYRYVQWYIDSVQRVIDLEAEVLITGHGEPVRGAAEIRSRLTRMRDAAQYLRDRTFEGMNAGKGLWELMDTIRLPEELAIPQGHGKVPWIVRSIWEEHLGWFRYESSTELYAVPPQAVFPELVALAGGHAPVLGRARALLEEGKPLHALHLAEAIPAGEPGHRDALGVQLAAQRAVLEGAGRENFSEVRWLESEILRLETALGEAQ
ncbi:alkyl sulfatase dimerization domain-containing protein [Novosphingobium resinovorum]|uniref:alkyl sulfatase dimerization domain-containing protein n=1 Tax=Novosphingobium TaxID=165696 RepID=UPI0020032942|nr:MULTISPECIES: alkyl sulfatase dimerization domain-containing protein [Novosphingobium]WJM24724.1 alkyl sulfatase dimerization domain-containing protein [Novosphingobium resinovorum]